MPILVLVSIHIHNILWLLITIVSPRSNQRLTKSNIENRSTLPVLAANTREKPF